MAYFRYYQTYFDMKKLIVLILALAPVFSFAQDRAIAAREAAARQQMEREAQDDRFSDIFLEFMVADQGGRQVIRVVKESDILNRLDDKRLQRDLESMAQRTYSTVADLMTYMAASGWAFVTQFELDVRGQRSIRFVFSRRLAISSAMITGEKTETKEAAGAKGGMQGNTPTRDRK